MTDPQREDLARLTEAYLEVAVKLGLSIEQVQAQMADLSSLELARGLDKLTTQVQILHSAQGTVTSAVDSLTSVVMGLQSAAQARAEAVSAGFRLVSDAIRNSWTALLIGALLGMGAVSMDDAARFAGKVIGVLQTEDTP